MARIARIGWGALTLVTSLLACSSAGDGDEDGASDGGSSGGSSGSEGSAPDGGSSGMPAASSGGSSGTPSAEARACQGTTAAFSTPGAVEYVQWQVNGAQKEALPPPGGAYFFNGYINLTTYAADYSGSVSIVVGGSHTTLAAGTYGCAQDGSIAVNGLGVANAQAAGADCAVTYDETVTDGGRMKGSFWAYFPASTGPVQSAGGCVHGRFDVTDAPP